MLTTLWQLSSSWVVIHKIIGTLMAVLMFVVAISSAVFGDEPLPATLSGMLIFLAMGSALCWYAIKLKFVRTDGRNLYVSSFFREISTPLTNVRFVWNFWGLWPVVVELESKTKYGRKIVFLPSWRPLPFGDHPVTLALRNLVEQARQNNGRPL